MNISVSSLVRRLERELEAEKLKSAKLEIERNKLLDYKNREEVMKELGARSIKSATEIRANVEEHAKISASNFAKAMESRLSQSPIGDQFPPSTV